MSKVRCPAPTCMAIFEIPAARLGRNIYCLECGTRMTARPLEVDAVLATRPSRSGGGRGAVADRLPLTVLVDSVRSLWNVGSIFRTADACGVSNLILTGICGCPPRPEIAKTALGAELSVPWSYEADPLEAAERCVAQGQRLVGLEAADDAEALDGFTWASPVCLVIGNEAAGINPLLRKRCHELVAIPMRGTKSSLNVAVAFGIAAHSASRALIESRNGI